MHGRFCGFKWRLSYVLAGVLAFQTPCLSQVTAVVDDHESNTLRVVTSFEFDDEADEDAVDIADYDCTACCNVCLPAVPNMIGDFFNGYPAGIRGGMEMDRLLIIADDLDVPLVLPPAGSPLTITEPGPVGIFATSVLSIQQLQQLLRSGGGIPPAALVGSVSDQATMTTALSVAQIQALLVTTPGVGYDIVPLVTPPGSYYSAVDALFNSRNGSGGTTAYDAAGSGAMLQGGVDTLVGGEDFDAFYYYTYAVIVQMPSPSAGIGPLGRMKVAEGNSPLPRNRAYFRYGLFDAVPMTASGVGLNRFVPGFERTFLDDTMSLEMRFPFAATTDSTMGMGAGGLTNTDSVQFGNVAAYLKSLLYSTNRLSVSGGLGMTIPTADDLSVQLVDGTEMIRIDNEAIHLHPFLAAAYTPNDRWFAQGFCQLDVAANGNSVAVNTGRGLTEAGSINDSTFLFADVGLGYWLHRCPNSRITGIAPMVELHYNTSLQGADYVTAGPLAIGNFGDNVEALNLTVGSTFTLGQTTNLSVGYITPLGGGSDRQLDGGLRVMVDYFPQGRF